MHSSSSQQQSKDSQNQKRSIFQENHKYHLYQLVWAKVTGYPWWPGKIISLGSSLIDQNDSAKNKNISGRKQSNEYKHTVLFIKQGLVSFLDQTKIRPYVIGQDPPGVDDQTKMGRQWNISKKLFDRQLKLAIQFYKNNSQSSSSFKQHIQMGYDDVQSSYKNSSFKRESDEDYEYRQKSVPVHGKKLIQKTPKKILINQINKKSVSKQKLSNQGSQSSQQRSKNLKKVYMNILTRKGFQRRKALLMVSKILQKPTNFSFMMLDKLGQQQMTKLLKQKTMQELQQILE